MTVTASCEKPARRKRFVRAHTDHPLTPDKLDALLLVAESKFLSTRQVAALMGKSDKAMRDHLRNLFDMGLLDVAAIPGVAVGSSALIAANIHSPTKQGIKVLEGFEMLPDGAGKAGAYQPTQYAFLAHELAVRDMLVWLTLASRSMPGHSVAQWDCSAGLIAGNARPDAVFTYDLHGKAGITGILEADMGTERSVSGNRADRWAAKVEAYSHIIGDAAAMRALTGKPRARLAVTVRDAARARWVAERLKGTPAGEFAWIAVRSELDGARFPSAPVWLRPDGTRRPFVPEGAGT